VHADRIHILGASGSGTSTLGAAIAARYGHSHIDVDNYFWMPSDPPFQQPRDVDERRRMLTEELDAHPRWVLAGSLCGWGDVFVPRFQLVIFIFVPPDLRMARLKQRELERYGADAIAPGGRMHETYEAFIQWAAAYDTADESIRSLRRHEQWMAALPCRWVRIEGALTIDEQLGRLSDLVGGE
jgi:adenylate kinase family enzyme